MKVLLIIDMQKGFISNKKYLKLNQKVNDFISKSSYDKYIFTQFINKKSKNPFYQNKIGWQGLTTKQEQDFSVALPKNSQVFKKYGYSLSQDDLKSIKSLNISEIDICGVKAEACVYAISLQLWDNGIYPNILTNLVLGDKKMTKIYKKQFGSR
ncbi:MAG: isochorismatase family protein [Clostridia bacterium]|nr:isochorismatase family protein [Clostridia bacterium]